MQQSEIHEAINFWHIGRLDGVYVQWQCVTMFLFGTTGFFPVFTLEWKFLLWDQWIFPLAALTVFTLAMFLLYFSPIILSFVMFSHLPQTVESSKICVRDLTS